MRFLSIDIYFVGLGGIFWFGWKALRGAFGGWRPLIAGCSCLQRLGMDLPITRPVWDSNLGPPRGKGSMPQRVCIIFSCTKWVQYEVCIHFFGRGMGRNITARYSRKRALRGRAWRGAACVCCQYTGEGLARHRTELRGERRTVH